MKFPRTLLAGALLAAPSAFAADKKDNSPSDTGGVTIDNSGPAKDAKETPAQRNARMAWWRDAKFGLFIHWGLYAIPGGRQGKSAGVDAWIMHTMKAPVAKYREYAAQFNPVKYDPAQWAKLAKDAGMKYIVITSKHHDGFALFPSDVSTWDIADATPYKKDLLAPLVQSAKSEGLKIGFYYSQAQDWNNPGGAKSGYNDDEGWDDAHKGSFDDYLKSVAVPQVKELLTRYPIDILWWDTPHLMTVERCKPLASLAKTIRPGLITNDRLGANFYGDMATPEQFVPLTASGSRDWETCMTMNNHWGYNIDDQKWKSSAELIRMLADVCAKGGNLLLNVGPTAEGEIPAASVERLRDIGKWMHVNSESIYGTTAGPFNYLSWGAATRKGDTLFLHVFEWPKDGKLRIPLANEPLSAELLVDGKKLTAKSEDGRIVIDLPATAPDAVDSVIAMKIKGEPVTKPSVILGATVTASASKPDFAPGNITDATKKIRWKAPQDAKSGSLEIELEEATTVAAIAMAEPDVWPRMKQKCTLEAFVDGAWKLIDSGATEGHGLKKNITPVTARKFRLTLECDKGSPAVNEMQLYRPE